MTRDETTTRILRALTGGPMTRPALVLTTGSSARQVALSLGYLMAVRFVRRAYDLGPQMFELTTE